MVYEEYSNNHGGEGTGYSREEAEIKRIKVDEAHGVGQPNSKWAPAKIVDDARGGFKVVHSTI